MVKALKYVLLFILYYRYLSFRAQYQYSELLQLAFEACYAPRAFFIVSWNFISIDFWQK